MEPIVFDKPLKVDRRPLWLIVADRTVRYQVIAALLIAVTILFSLDPPQGLTIAGYRSLILFGACIFVWVSGLLPLAVTSLLAMAMLPLLGILDRKQTYALFGNEAVFFILGAFILGAAMTGTGFRRVWRGRCWPASGETPPRLALTVFLLSALLSFVMSEHAVAAMMFPVVAEIACAQSGNGSNQRSLRQAPLHVDRLGLHHRRHRHLPRRRQGAAGGGDAAGSDRPRLHLLRVDLAAACMIVLPLAGHRLSSCCCAFSRPTCREWRRGSKFLNRKRLEMGQDGLRRE